MVKNKTAFKLLNIVIFLTAISSGGGLLIRNLYQDNAYVKLAWRANDIITFFFIVPFLIIAKFFAQKGDFRWLLILFGLLGYVFYNYSFYLFGARFNNFFLLYTSLLFLSAFALVLFLSQGKLTNISIKFSSKAPVKWISMYLFVIASMLLIIEISMIIPFLTSNIIPETIRLTGSITSIVFALDFSIVIPVSFCAALNLWQRKSWGFVLSIIMLVKGLTYGLVLCIGTISLAYSNIYARWDPLLPFYVVIALGGLFCCFLLFNNFDNKNVVTK